MVIKISRNGTCQTVVAYMEDNDMKKINFKNFRIYVDVSHKSSRNADVREQFADMIYKNAGGIKAHALALKIYNSKGETEYNKEEVGIMRVIAEKFCLPGFIDGLMEQIGEEPNNCRT